MILDSEECIHVIYPLSVSLGKVLHVHLVVVVDAKGVRETDRMSSVVYFMGNCIPNIFFLVVFLVFINDLFTNSVF